MLGILKIGILSLCLFVFNIFAAQIEPLKIKAGLLEGINELDFTYKLIEFNADGKHRMFTLGITSAFSKMKFRQFSDDDINCNISECTINITNQQNPDDNTRLIIAPYLDKYFKVIEISTNQYGQPIFTQSYQLDKQKNTSTVREFLNMNGKRMGSLKSIPKNEFYGFWLGILNIDGKPELLSLEAHPDSTSYFIRFVNGQSVTNKTTFTPDNVTKKGDVIYITTEHKTFANKLLIHNSNSVLEGYMYSSHKGVTLQKGSFRLYRMKE